MKSIKGETVVGVAHCLKLEHHTKSPLEYTTRILPEPPLSTKVKKKTTKKQECKITGNHLGHIRVMLCGNKEAMKNRCKLSNLNLIVLPRNWHQYHKHKLRESTP